MYKVVSCLSTHLSCKLLAAYHRIPEIPLLFLRNQNTDLLHVGMNKGKYRRTCKEKVAQLFCRVGDYLTTNREFYAKGLAMGPVIEKSLCANQPGDTSGTGGGP